jgi:hypothetical protein
VTFDVPDRVYVTEETDCCHQEQENSEEREKMKQKLVHWKAKFFKGHVAVDWSFSLLANITNYRSHHSLA